MNYYKPRFFSIQELFSRGLYAEHGKNCLKWIDSRLSFTADEIRKRYNKSMIINDWSIGGVLENRGFREPACKVGAFLSDHKFGRAIDFNISGITPEEIRVDILSNPDCKAFQFITTIEMKINWVHIAIRNIDKTNKNIELIYP